jgi:cytoskeletal protein RodZ
MPVPAAFPIPEKDAARRPSRVALYGVVSGVIGLVLAIVVIAVASRRHDQSSADSAMASASAAPPQAAPSAAPEPAQSSSAPAASAEPPAKFNAKKARGALDKTWKQITHCRKGKAVGVGMTTVTFDNDGSVANVVVGPPFKGTPTATCVAEAMSTAHMQPFVGHPGVVTYRIFIAAH